MKSLLKIYGPDAAACERCYLAINEIDPEQQHKSSIHLFDECLDTNIFADIINNELQQRCNFPFIWTKHRFFTLAQRKQLQK
jgi:hypothetical protein